MLKEQIIEFLTRFAVGIPLTWDRVTGNEPESTVLGIYGWIEKNAQQKDFVLVLFDKDDEAYLGYWTSSVLYSEAFTKNLQLMGYDDVEHFPCMSYHDFLNPDYTNTNTNTNENGEPL
jgi:hypothetical protein